MRKYIFLFICILLLNGCVSEVSVSEIDIEDAKLDVQLFINHVKDENGRFLYFNDKKEIYIFLNGIFVQSGRDAVYYTDFHVNAEQHTLNVFFNEEYDSDYTNPLLKYQVLYKIASFVEFEQINLFSNGEPIPFDRTFTIE